MAEDRGALHDTYRLSAVARVMAGHGKANEMTEVGEEKGGMWKSQKEVERAVVLAPWEGANWTALAFIRCRSASAGLEIGL